ncbi:MAG: NAD(P)-dependent alcohol dehydrogenase [Sphingobium sp.]
MTKIFAAITTAPGEPLKLSSADLDALRDDEVLVRIKGVGICHTDLVVLESGGYAPGVLGHEGAGVVEEVGRGVTHLVPGDHVVLSYYACHKCATCIDGAPAHCERALLANGSGKRFDGSSLIHVDGQPINGAFFSQSSFATHAIARDHNAVKVPSDLPIELLGPLGCGFLTGAGTVLKALEVKEGRGVAVFGSGAVGLAAVMAAKVVGADPIIAIDRVPERLEIACRLGATHVINGNDVDVAEELGRIEPKGLYYAVETTGLPQFLEIAVAALRPTGVCALLGISKPGATAAIDLSKLLYGRTVRGVIEGECDPQEFIPKLIDLHRQGKFPFEILVRTYPLDKINEAMADMKAGRTIKPVLIPNVQSLSLLRQVEGTS